MVQSSSSPPSNPAQPSPPQILLFFVLLIWLAAAAIIAGMTGAFLPSTWPEAARSGLVVALLAALLLIPFGGFALLTRRPGWTAARPLALILVGVGLYITLDAAIRTIAGPPAAEGTYLLPLSGTILRLILLTPAALLLGGIGLWWTSALPSRGELRHALGLNLPGPLGLLLALAAIAILTLGWPLTGALGDSWTSQLLLIQTLTQTLPEELFFRGAVLALLFTFEGSTFNVQRSTFSLRFWPLALFTYLAFTPSLIVPHGDWAKLSWLFTALPLTWLLIELRRLSGSIWPGLLLACCCRAAPFLFTDPRDELLLITQPWQTAAHLWLLLGAGGLALLLWVGRRWLLASFMSLRSRRLKQSPRGEEAEIASAYGLAMTSSSSGGRYVNIPTAIAAVAALFGWTLWLGLWLSLGRPGFYNDGFLILMTEQADLTGAAQIADLPARRAFVRDRLIETATRTQVPVRQALAAAGLAYRPFYLINMIRVEGQHRRMAEFAALPGVARVMLNPNVRPYPWHFDIGYGDTSAEGQGVEANLSQVYADQVWEQGFTGQGIVVGGQDTGYDWQHSALRSAYRGVSTTGEVNHNYNWHDAWADTREPFDDGQHGTHTMGTILGDDGQGNQIGMAPGAAWIGCRNMQRGLGNPASYTDCMEFFLAPYPLGGDPFSEGDVTKAPAVVNNSWGCPDIEGCDDDVLAPATAALHAAGIMMVVSAGNDGPACGTAHEPPARYDSVFSVGATDARGAITGFSSRGPITGEDGQPSLLKPDISAPGDTIRSSVPGGGYGTASGTSMAGPHVTGLVALIWSANPALIGQIEATEEIIRQSATPVDVEAACPIEGQFGGDASVLSQLDSLTAGNACACGGVTGVPNNVYGWGQIDALRAVELARVWK